MKIGIIGRGPWGKIYLKNLESDFPYINIHIAGHDAWRNLLDCDGIIATPPDTHLPLAEVCLKYNIPVLIEKPISTNIFELKEFAIKYYDKPILVNNIHLFSSSYQLLKSQIANKKIIGITSQGFNFGPIRNYSSLWDYGTHDISMLVDLFGTPENIQAVLMNHNELGALYEIILNFEGFKSYSTIGNLGNNKARDLRVFTTEGEIRYFEENHIKYYSFQDQIIPETTSTLVSVIQTFIDLIENNSKDYRLGLDIAIKTTKILTEAERYLSVKRDIV